MFDIDGTLIQSFDFDEACYLAAVKEVTGLELVNNWETYPFVTDRGILQTFIERQAPHYLLNDLERLVKPIFIRNIKAHLDKHPAQEVVGAKDFVDHLLADDHYIVSIATGGWGETALLKLGSAGFDTDKLNITSSNDHHARTEIMKLAKKSTENFNDVNLTYFGDAEWDVRACTELGYNLVIVGNRIEYDQSIKDFRNVPKVLTFVLV